MRAELRRMALGLAGLLAIAATASWARAAGEPAAAEAAVERGEPAQAIELATQGLAAPAISADEQADLYVIRASAYEATGGFDRAAADYTSALQLFPDSAQLRFRRGVAYREDGRYAEALADIDAAMAPRGEPAPELPFLYGERGVVQFALGSFAGAARDFGRVIALDPRDVYAPLWAYVSGARAGQPNAQTLAGEAAAVDPARWPGPIYALYLGRSTPEAARAAAATGEPAAISAQRCEAAFFVGEYELLRSAPAAARAPLQEVLDNCPPTLSVQAGAAGELRRLPP